MSDQDKEVAYVDCDRCSDCRRLAVMHGQRFVDKSTGSACPRSVRWEKCRTDGLDVSKEVEEMKDRLNELSLKSSYKRITTSENLVS